MGKSAAVIALIAIGAWLFFGGSSDSSTGLDLTQVSIEVERRADAAWPPDVQVVRVREGIATVRLPLLAGDVAEARTLEAPSGQVRLRIWKLPIRPAPELISRGELPRLEGLDYTRLVDASTAVEEPPGFYVGEWPELGHVLLTVEAEEEPAPESVILKYPVFAAEGFGDERLEGSARELLTALSVDGSRTARSLALPHGSTLRLGFEPYVGGRFRARLTSFDPDPFEAVILTDVGELWRGTISSGQRAFDLELPPGEVERIELRTRARDLVFLENPRLAPSRPKGDTPNVLMVVVDTLRADRVTPELMPHLSALREESLAFEECWATSSWTLPSVATLMTSNHGGQHRAWLNDQTLGLGIDTLAEAFAGAGHRTAAFTGGIFVSQTFGLDRGFDLFDSSGGGVERVVERAEAWMARSEGEPWFVLLHTYEVHAPYEPPADAAKAIDARYPELAGSRPPEPQAYYDDVDERTAGYLSELYDAEAHYADAVLGDFFDRLAESGALDSTVVAVTSDHGEEFGEHGLLGHTDTLYVEQLAVPFFLRLPGGERGGERVSSPVSHLDFAPPLLDAAGLASRTPPSFVGTSLLSGDAPSPLFASRNLEEIGLLYALRDGDWSLIEGNYLWTSARKEQGRELYDLSTDAGQRNNRAVPGSLEPLWSRLDQLIDVYGRARAMPDDVESPAVLDDLRKAGYVGQ